MKWEKRGLIYQPDSSLWWSKKYGILPTPCYSPKKNLLRIFFASTDENIFGRASFIDVNPDNPSEIIYRHLEPVLDIGELGTFDDCGVNVSSLVKINNKWLMYYVGYQRTFRVPYMLFMGLAKSNDDLEKFERVFKAPLLDRKPDSYISHAAPFVIQDNDIFKMWFWSGKKWVVINDKTYISASIGYAESNDGYNWIVKSHKCIVPNEETEFSVGRPWVLKTERGYSMFYSVRKKKELYRIGYAESDNGLDWIRKDNKVGIDVSASGWDSEMICYPAVIRVKDRTFMFYNGNNNGATGFGYAELIEN